MRKLLFGLFLSLVASATSAQWVFVGENTSRDKSYADPATKRRTGNVVRMWVLTDYSKPGVIDGKVSLLIGSIRNTTALREPRRFYNWLFFREKCSQVNS